MSWNVTPQSRSRGFGYGEDLSDAGQGLWLRTLCLPPSSAACSPPMLGCQTVLAKKYKYSANAWLMLFCEINSDSTNWTELRNLVTLSVELQICLHNIYLYTRTARKVSHYLTAWAVWESLALDVALQKVRGQMAVMWLEQKLSKWGDREGSMSIEHQERKRPIVMRFYGSCVVHIKSDLRDLLFYDKIED